MVPLGHREPVGAMSPDDASTVGMHLSTGMDGLTCTKVSILVKNTNDGPNSSFNKPSDSGKTELLRFVSSMPETLALNGVCGTSWLHILPEASS
jgi:hypothetical protein